MGKGDKKTKKGKRFMGSFGVIRPKKKSKGAYVASPAKAKAKPAAVKVEEVVEEVKAVKAPAKKAAAKKAPAKKAAAKKSSK